MRDKRTPKEVCGEATATQATVVPKPYRSKGQPRSTRNEFRILATAENAGNSISETLN